MEETRKIWVRLGVTIIGTKEEIENVIKGNPVTLYHLVLNEGYSVDGESYIPESCVEEYNKTYGANHKVKNVEFNF